MIKQKILESLDRYWHDHVPTGQFLRCCLENNFVDAVCRADDDNILVIVEIAKYIYNEIPAPAWGTPDKVRKWLGEPMRTVQETKNGIVIEVIPSHKFKEGTLLSKWVSAEKGISGIVGEFSGETHPVIQSLIFNRSKWTIDFKG